MVVAGGYQESGDAGRFNVGPGDALVHLPFEAHRNDVSTAGAIVLNLPCANDLANVAICRVANPDALVAAARSDLQEAAALLAAMAYPCTRTCEDWPDILARQLRELAPFRIAEWADLHGLAPESVSRGFARAYGVTPHRYRAEARARQAVAAIQSRGLSLAAIAVDLGFSDQAHMTRAVRSLTGRTPKQLWTLNG